MMRAVMKVKLNVEQIYHLIDLLSLQLVKNNDVYDYSRKFNKKLMKKLKKKLK